MVQRWASCHQLIQAGELLRGSKYQMVMRWRPDIRPLTAFPPLADPVWTHSHTWAKHVIVPGLLQAFGSTTALVFFRLNLDPACSHSFHEFMYS